MKKIKFTISFLLLIIISGCKNNIQDFGQPNFASPHYFNEVWAVAGIYYYPGNNPAMQPVKANIENDKVRADEFCLALFATDDTPFIHIAGEEKKEEGEFIELPFWRKEYRYISHQKEKESSLISQALIECISEEIKTNFGFSITYVVDKITDINITADVTLWGIQPGNSLNEQLYLFRTPIVSGENYTLVDCNQNGTEWSVNDWVALTPVGHQDSYFKFKTIPQELPLDVKFTIHVTSEKNKSFTATTKSVYITPE